MSDFGFITAMVAIMLAFYGLVVFMGGLFSGFREPLCGGGGILVLTVLYLAIAWFVSIPIETILFVIYFAGIVYVAVRFNPAPASRER